MEARLVGVVRYYPELLINIAELVVEIGNSLIYLLTYLWVRAHVHIEYKRYQTAYYLGSLSSECTSTAINGEEDASNDEGIIDMGRRKYPPK